ncbi:MAG TPA: rhomboid family intramembrane serine protease [Gemmatimonadaceae bacterium]|nr:rhomboid family intramembrane serine protease [Gemmatimonadaceae bacterium]
MIPLSDELPTLRPPVMTYAILAALVGTWVFVQGAGFNEPQLAASICNLGMVPGEITHQARLGTGVPLGDGMACIIDKEQINIFTPLISMFLHGGWIHLLGNCLFFWVFGNNIEDSMGHFRFLVFYLICGLAAAGTHILMQPRSPVPTVGASGAISGVLGAYLVLYPRVRVKMLFFFIVFFKTWWIPAWAVLLWWIGWQVISALPELTTVRPEVSGGVAVWAHIGGFVTGLILVKLFENPRLVARHIVAA